MQERAAEVGGTLSVSSAAEGTVVSARLPLSLRGAVDHTDPR
jgi:signal transduction histidine kinase